MKSSVWSTSFSNNLTHLSLHIDLFLFILDEKAKLLLKLTAKELNTAAKY